jgi:hypothetical protein
MCEQHDWEHAKAVSALRRVRLEIDPMIVDLVSRFANKIKDHGWKRVKARTVANTGSTNGPLITT